MQKAHDAQYNNYWQNLPSVDTPIIAAQLNRNEQSVDAIDDRVVAFDTSKANQSDMLLAIKTISFDAATGTFTITLFNGTSSTINTDIEKIPVNFDYDDDPQSAHYQNLIIELDDGTYKYIDMTALVTEYDFASTDTIAATVTSGVVSMDIVNGSVTDEKIQPNYLADLTAQATASANAATAASGSRVDSEAWAVGTRNGTPVQMGDPTFQNNSKYYAEHGTGTSFIGLSDTDFQNLENGQVAVYDADTTMWVNTTPDFGMTARIVINADNGSTVSVTTPSGETITPTSVSTTVWRADVNEYGIYTVTAISGGTTRTEYVTIDTVKVYTVTISGQASITFTTGIPSDLTVAVGAQTITTFPSTVALAPGEYTISYTYGDPLSLTATWTSTITLSANESKTVNVVVPGATLSPTGDVQGWLMCAEIYNKNYTTVSQVLADSTTFNALIASHNAVDYMARSASFSSHIVGDSAAMTAIGLDNYCSNALLSNTGWLAAICASPYFESVLNVKVPTMTSDTAPSGTVIGTTAYSTRYRWCAFDGNASSFFTHQGTSVPVYIGYGFTAKKLIKCVKVLFGVQGTATVSSTTLKVQGSDDNSTWTDLTQSESYTESASYNYSKIVLYSNSTKYQYYRLNISAQTASVSNLGLVTELQFYGRDDV